MQITGPTSNLVAAHVAGRFLPDVMSAPAPLDVPTPLWRLMNAEQRRDVLAAGTGQQSERCEVEVRYTPVAGGLANHAFVVTTDSDSTRYFRGGPSAGGPASSASSGSTPMGGSSQSSEVLGSASGGSASGRSGSGGSRSSDSGNGSSPGSGRGGPDRANGPWGPIVTDHGAYRRGTIDWTTAPVAATRVANLPGNCDRIEGRLAAHADAIEAAGIPYNPLGANSNATAREMLERSGINAGSPAVRAPGWYVQLP